MSEVLQSYCTVRYVSIIATSVLIGVSLISIAVYLQTGIPSTNDYKKVKAVVTGGYVTTSSVYLKLVYQVDGKDYDSQLLDGKSFKEEKDAQAYLDQMINQTIVVYYDPIDPLVLVHTPGAEDMLTVGFSFFALVLFACSYGIYLLRDNPILCGATIANDVISLVRN